MSRSEALSEWADVKEQRAQGIGQIRLTRREQARLPLGNQYTDEPSIMEWQVVKAHAVFHGVRDWTSKVDSTLTYEENCTRMRQCGVRRAPSMKNAPIRNLEARPK